MPIWISKRILHFAFSNIKSITYRAKLDTVFIDYEKSYDKINRLFFDRSYVGTKMTKAIKAIYMVVKFANR